MSEKKREREDEREREDLEKEMELEGSGDAQEEKEDKEERQDANSDREDDEEDDEVDDADGDNRAQNAQDALFARLLRTVLINQGGAFQIFGQDTNGNDELVAMLKRRNTIKSASVENAFLAVPREYFVTAELREEAYHDTPQRFAKMNFNISAPHMHAMCLEELNIAPGQRVLDIGSGSGHLTAMMGFLVGPAGLVHGLDLHDYIIEFAKSNVHRFMTEHPDVSLEHVHFIKRNCFLPVYPFEKYDRIHVGACCPQAYLEELYAMLLPHGVLVTPYGDELVCCVKNEDDSVTQKALCSVRYSDLTLPSAAEVKEAQRQIEIARAHEINVPMSDVRGQFAALLRTGNGADVTFDEQRIAAHRLVLSLRSPVLERYLASFAPGVDVPLPFRCSAAVWRQVLQWIYTDNCQPPSNSSDAALMLETAKALEITSLVHSLEQPQTFPMGSHTDTLLSMLEKAVGKAHLADVRFLLDDGSELPAHQLILETRAEHFARLFSWQLRESRERTIRVPECSRDTMLAVLRFLYTDNCELDGDSAVALLEQANFFQLPRLTAMCEDFWHAHMNDENACEVLAVAERFNADQLRKFAQEYIFEHVASVVETAAFKGLDQSVVARLLVAAVQRGNL